MPDEKPAAGGHLLGPVRGVTTTAADLAAVEAAYTAHLGYRVRERAAIAPETARAWGAPAIAGRPALVLEPESGEPTYLRFVEQAHPPGFKACTTWGWAATEIIVQDAYALAERLADSPFRVVGPARPLDSSDSIHAMQAIGPAGEMLYFAMLRRPIPGREMPTARSFVDRCFITVLGAPDLPAAARFYEETFGAPPNPTFTGRIRSLAGQNQLSPETQFDLTTTELPTGSKIEIDQYLDFAGPRPRPDGGLPAGMALVTFECRDFDRFAGRMLAPPAPAQLPPHQRRRAGVLTGAAGELIELVEA
jgi:catechol 2,3-dioxygenase-like lactoylglutathione lyase family enzyme